MLEWTLQHFGFISRIYQFYRIPILSLSPGPHQEFIIIIKLQQKAEEDISKSTAEDLNYKPHTAYSIEEEGEWMEDWWKKKKKNDVVRRRGKQDSELLRRIFPLL